MINDLMKLAKDCEADIRGDAPLDDPIALADKQRIAAAVGEMTAVVNEYTRQRERDLHYRNGSQTVAFCGEATLLPCCPNVWWVRESIRKFLLGAAASMDETPGTFGGHKRTCWNEKGASFQHTAYPD